ncbi:choice-of-anchor L domain-containing protein [Yoonia sp. MH D7]
MPTARELTINNTASATALAQNIFGQGTVVNSATITGQDVQSGIYTGANTTLGSIAPSDSGVILSTGKVADFTNSSGSTNTNTSASTSTNNNGAGYSPLDAITGQATKDAVVLKINFTPTGDYITMQFVFSSEEYLEYVNGGVNDAFGVWVNGSYVPFTPADNDLVSIDTINSTNASNLYLDNPRSADTYNTEMDGLTVTLSIKAPVISGEPNTMVIALADSGDSLYDTNVLISANSIQTIALAFDDNVTMEANTQIIVDVLDNDTDSTNSGLTITEINGISIVVGQTVTVPTGESITLNADGTITIKNDGDIGSQTFTYAVIDGAGNTDVGFVTVNTVKDTPLNYIVEGGAGDDVINTSYTGDPQGDKIDNSDHSDGSNNDSITAGDGNDQVTSGLGDDTIDAGNGNDFVNAGSGDDTVFGGNGNDMIVGGSGNDQIYGGSGDDLIFGGSGNDTIDGGLGADIIDAGIGDDDITFFNGDNIYGGAGNDTFNASEFGDTTTSAITIAGGNDDESPKGTH